MNGSRCRNKCAVTDDILWGGLIVVYFCITIYSLSDTIKQVDFTYHHHEKNGTQLNDDRPNRFSGHHLPKVLDSSSFAGNRF